MNEHVRSGPLPVGDDDDGGRRPDGTIVAPTRDRPTAGASFYRDREPDLSGSPLHPTPEAAAELGAGVAARGEDVIDREHATGRAADPGRRSGHRDREVRGAR